MWKDWLSFSRNEQYGILLLVMLILFLLVLRLIMPFFFNPKEDVSPEQYSNIVQIRKAGPALEEPATDSGGEIEMTSFNPNSVSVSRLQAMGVSPRAIVNWIKYREAGGRFVSPDDILKIYGIDSLLATRIIPFANFDEETNYPRRKTDAPDKEEGKWRAKMAGETHTSYYAAKIPLNAAGKKRTEQDQDDTPAVTEHQHFVVEINGATPDDLMKLRGLGPVLSKRIVDFRKILGGFWSVEQVKEVYGITPELYEQLVTNLCVDSAKVERFEVNSSSLRHLNKHPYINFYQARDIVEYRKKHGSISGTDELIQLPSFSHEEINRLRPYLVFTADTLGSKQ